jgi:hypothetical protein
VELVGVEDQIDGGDATVHDGEADDSERAGRCLAPLTSAGRQNAANCGPVVTEY